MITVFSGDSANKAWISAADRFLRDTTPTNMEVPAAKPTDSRGGQTIEMLHCVFSVSDPRSRWVLDRVPPLNPAFALAEVVGIVLGIGDAEFYNYWNRQLPTYAGDTDRYEGSYGVRLHEHFGIDQLQSAYEALSRNPLSRQVVLEYYDVQTDLPKHEGQPNSEDIPCNLVSILKVREGRLEWSQIVRSNDLFLGVPYNFVQFTYLQEIIAGWLGLRLGGYVHYSDSLHVYRRDLKRLMARASTIETSNGDSLRETRSDSLKFFMRIHELVSELVSGSKTEVAHRNSVRFRELPSPYCNILMLLIAESSRRNGYPALAREIMAACTNPILRQVWDAWLARVKKC